MSEAPTVGEPQLREAFEKRFSTGHRQTDAANFAWRDGCYVADRIQAIWEGWRAALATLPVVPRQPVAWRYKDARGHWRYTGSKPDDYVFPLLKPEPLFTLPVGDVEPREQQSSHLTERAGDAVRRPLDGDRE